MNYLQKWDAAKHAIEEARSIDELKGIRDKAEALRQYARQSRETLDVQNKCAEIKLRCERRMGGMLKETELNKGGEWAHKEHQSQAVTSAPKLSDIGISRMQSSRYQAIARLPEDKFEQHINQTIADNKELTEAGVISFVKQVFRSEDIAKQREKIKEGIAKLPEGKFDAIAIDPPWPYGNADNYDPNKYRSTTPYPEMSIAEIRALEIPAADNSFMWLWTTHQFLEDAFDLMKTWGFEYKAVLVWDKEKMGIGQMLRKQCEFCLLGIKGKPKWFGNDVRDIIREARTEHSKKPESFYKLVDKVCEGRKIEIFSRQKREGWDVWGDEVV